MQAWDYQSTKMLFLRGTTLSWCALFAAYALGQLCSMLLKREVLAGFLALLFSAVLAAWAVVVMFWRLNPVWFVLPLGVGAMLATWLQAPDWIVGRHRLRTWLMPALVIVVPLVGMMLTLPAARLAQLDLPEPEYPFLEEPLQTSLARMAETRAEGQKTSLEYERLYSEFSPRHDMSGIKIDGKTWQEWDMDRFIDERTSFTNYQAGQLSVVQTGQLSVVYERFRDELNRKYAQSNQPVVERLLELSQRPHCRFPRLSNSPYSYEQNLLDILYQDGMHLVRAGELDGALTRYCAWIRIQGHLHQGQTSSTRESLYRHYVPWQGYNYPWQGYNGVYAWAQHVDQTSERIKEAITQLQECYKELPHPREAILADWELIRNVLNEKEMPSFMKTDYRRASQYLAYLTNKFPWERQRAIEALDYLTVNSLNYVDAVVRTVDGETLDALDRRVPKSPRELIRFAPWRGSYALNKAAFNGRWKSFQQAGLLLDQCQTSHLVKQELDQSGQLFDLLQGWVDAETRRRALLVQLALLAYRLDHEKYPETLAQLTPDYLPEAVLDPFSGENFRYSAQGYELPITRFYTYQEEIPAGTPLLWGVGSGNSKLREEQEQERQEQESGRTMLRFRPTETVGHYSYPNQVFPLPK